jgi:hypothetical protein
MRDEAIDGELIPCMLQKAGNGDCQLLQQFACSNWSDPLRAEAPYAAGAPVEAKATDYNPSNGLAKP